ncbi:MAG TPA: putative porin, partial [Pyrinomonadaceae bacterium]|nr:putative porin [Pyrinomonadaceae bacterium]
PGGAAATPPDAAPAGGAGMAGDLFGLEEVRRQLREQREQLEQLRAAVREQAQLIEQLRSRVGQPEMTAGAGPRAAVRDAAYTAGGAAASEAGAGGAQQTKAEAAPLEERVARAEAQAKKAGEAVAKQLGSITFSGDIRFRYESFYGQTNTLPSSENPAALGNPLSTRQRFRVRARFGARGKITDEFEWGLRLATGAFPDVISTNQTLTDFFSRKNFTLDLAYVSYKPSRLPGLQLQAGKFEIPWVRTEMTWDNDLNPEGLTESYTRSFEKSLVRRIDLVAWQSPFLERGSAFVLGADGRVDLEASGRAGRDLALYGAQARTELGLAKNVTLRLSAADLYFHGTQFITPAQVFGTNLLIPVTVTIPASGTTPARTVTAQVAIPRDLLVSGNANLGVSLGSTNAIGRDGRLASGYNLVDLIGRLDFAHSKRWPVMLLFNYVVNTRARDFTAAGAGGRDVVVRNDEGSGYWAEAQVGKTQQRGDLLFNYVFTRIEKDAVLAPFNGSDFGIFTDVRVHRVTASYTADPRVVLSLIGFFTQRPNGLGGVFGVTPPGSLERTQTRLQFDTTFRF